MTEEDYAELAAACDWVLRGPGTSLGCVAIPFLHVISEHPGCLAQFGSLLEHSHSDPFPVSGPGAGSRTVARIGRGIVRSFLHRSETGAHGARLPEHRLDVLLISRLVNPRQLEQDRDFYFGDLERQLTERGLRSKRVFVDHLTNESARRAALDSDSTRRVLPRLTTPAVEARIWRHCAAVRRALRDSAAAARKPLDRHVAVMASQHAMLETTAANLRLHAAVAEICGALAPRIVITLHEGDASERIIWAAARESRHRPVCVGYQHTRILERAHAIRRCIAVAGIDCDPDAILTLGEIPHASLAASPALRSVQLITYGSHRRAGQQRGMPFRDRPRRCLVLPDGDEREVAILFEFAAECARRMPGVSFVLRPHPMLDFAAVRARHPALRELPGNVALSTARTLEEDSTQSRYCLYRGSSAVLHAVLAGVKPFYLARVGELSFDTLSGLDDWREVVTSVDEFPDRLRAADTSIDMESARRAWSYCDRYVSAVRPQAVDELLSLVDWSSPRRATTES